MLNCFEVKPAIIKMLFVEQTTSQFIVDSGRNVNHYPYCQQIAEGR